MKSIKEILPGNIGKENLPSVQHEPEWLLQKKHDIIKRYGEAQNFAILFNPSVQMKCALNIERSLKGEAPTLRQLLFTYDAEQVKVWLMAHMMDLNAFVGVREKMQLEQMDMLANVFITKCMFIKASEILLFFHKLKCGDLIEFYGAVDPLKVSTALNAFMAWRAIELNKIEVKRKEEKRLQQLEDSRKNAITREEYEQLKEKK